MKSKKILSLFLVVSMVLTLLPVNVFAISASSNGTLNVRYFTEGGSYISQQDIGFNAGNEIDTSDLTIPNDYALSTSKTGFWYGQNNNSPNYSFQSSNVYLHSFDWNGSTKYKFTKSSTDTANAIPNSSTGSSNPTAKVNVYLKHVPLLDHVDVRVNLVENVTTWVNGVSSTTTKNYTIDSASDVSIQVNGTTYTNPVLRIDGTAREYNFDLSRAEFALDANTAITITANITDEHGNEKAYIYTPDYAAMVEAANNCPRVGTNGAGLDFDLEANTIITNNTSSAVIINFVDEENNTIKTTTSNPYEYGTAYSETGVLPAGYELVNPSVSLTVAGIMGAGDVICTFTVRPINYNITYNLDGGTNSVNNPGTYTVKDSITFEEATKGGFEFGGWYSEPSFTNNVAGIPVGSTGAKTLYAKWTQDDITINYVAVTGGDVNKASETLNPSTGDVAGSTATANAGYDFIGWATSDTATTAAECISTNPHFVPSKVGGVYQAATYYAIFIQKNVTIIYQAGAGGTVSPVSETIKAKNGRASGSTAKPNDGYRFVDWKNADLTVVASGEGNEHYVPQKTNGVYVAATYYASFTKMSYAVTGSIDNGTVTNNNQTKEYEGHSDEMVFTAATGYHITGATVNGNAQTLPAGTTNTWTYPSQTVTGAITVAVTTEINGYDVTGTIDHSGTVSNGSQTVNHGSLSDEMVFTAATGYHIAGITINGSAQSLEGITTTYTYPATEVTGNIAVDVTTVEDMAVTLTYIAVTGGTVTDITSGEEVANTTEDVPPITGNAQGTTATNLTGYDFVNWTNSQNVVVSTSYSFTPSKTQGVYVAETYTANFAVRHHNFVVEDIYLNLLGIEVDELCSIEGEDEEESIPFNSEINSVKDDPIRGYEYSGMIVYVDEEETSRGQLSELGITIDVENGTLSGNLPDHQIWVKYLYNEVEKYDVTYTSEGRVTGMPEGIPDAIAGDEITISTTVPVRDGYHFLGWIPQINGDPIEVTDGKFIMPDSDVEIRASWEADENVLNYNVLYYTSEDELIATIHSTVLRSDPVVTEVEDKAPEGYKLQGYTFNGGELTTELNAEITEDGQTITVYYEKNDLIVKHIYGSNTVYDSNQSKANLSAEDKITVNAVKLGKYTRIISATLNGQALGSVSTVTVVSDGERKYEVVFTYAHKKPSSDPTPGEEVTIIEDPEVALEDSLEKINHYAYVFGYENGTVRPENKVTREEVATIFYRLLTDGTRDALFTREQDFPDVLASRWSNVAIATLLNGNIVSGYPDGEFKPGSYITRAEFATIVAKFDNLSYSGQSQFNDISGHWAENYINSAALKGWIKGYPDGSFHPEAYITRAEAITLINAVLGRQVNEDGLLPDAKYWPDNTAGKWYYEAIMEATNSHDYERESESDVETWTAVTEDKTWTER